MTAVLTGLAVTHSAVGGSICHRFLYLMVKGMEIEHTIQKIQNSPRYLLNIIFC